MYNHRTTVSWHGIVLLWTRYLGQRVRCKRTRTRFRRYGELPSSRSTEHPFCERHSRRLVKLSIYTWMSEMTVFSGVFQVQVAYMLLCFQLGQRRRPVKYASVYVCNRMLARHTRLDIYGSTFADWNFCRFYTKQQ